jgi:excinuclease ABC subunit A
MIDEIVIAGAREHNLKNVTVRIPKRKLVVFTGVSGSGKSSLAFDTLYAEGQRRYVESLSSYARQFLGQMEKPKYDTIRGLSPTIAIEQKAASNNPRSTVGTVTEVYDYLRVLYARLGQQHCHQCDRPVGAQTHAQIVDAVLALPVGTKLQILAPLVQNRKGEHGGLLEGAKERGFTRVRVDGRFVDLDAEIPKLDKKSKHDIALVIDRVVVKEVDRPRITDSLESALREGKGTLILALPEGDRIMSQTRACHHCGLSFDELSPQSFSFNSPVGACPDCNGLGSRPEMDGDLLVVAPEKSITDGAIGPWAASLARADGWKAETVVHVLKVLKINTKIPWSQLPEKQRRAVIHGDAQAGWEGLAPQLMRRYLATDSDMMKGWYAKWLSDKQCPTCHGLRLRTESRAVRIGDTSLTDLVAMTIADASAWIASIPLPPADLVVIDELRKEIDARLGFLLDVGLDYLTLGRPSGSLSGGESQRIRLASQIGSELTGVIYVLDEPSIGLHQRDNGRLLRTLERLRDIGNSVVVVEHDEDTIAAADWVCDFGPGAGELGGELVAEGPPSAIKKAPRSITGAFLSGKRRIEPPATRRPGNGQSIVVEGAREHNLQRVDASIPLGSFVCVTGVSGAGKSTLVNRILLPALMHHLHGSKDRVGAHDRLVGLEYLDKVIAIDQQPIGRTPRSNPATYTKIFDPIRELFAATKEARSYGYNASRFSFNVKGGACDSCGGDGVRRVEMHFLPDVFVQCEACVGRRFNDATLRVTFKDKTIADILNTSVREALELFSAHREIARGLRTLDDVGLGYMRLGQPSPTLSGGEAQRVKLSRELAKIGTGRTMYVLDEPTTGLHFADVERLVGVLQRLVDAGNSVVVIEHNLDVIKCADWIIDLGPEGGAKGGRIIATGTPEQVAENPDSATGHWLRTALGDRVSGSNQHAAPTKPTTTRPKKPRRRGAA